METGKKKTFIGIDVSKFNLDIWDTNSQKSRSIPNSKSGVEKLITNFQEPSSCLVVIEATGVYHRRAHQMFEASGFEVCVVNPYRSRKFADALGKLAKTDKIDAETLAIYGQRLTPPVTRASSRFLHRLKELTLKRRQLVEAKKIQTVQSKDTICELVRDMNIKHICFLDEQIKCIDIEIKSAIKSSSETSRKYDIMKSIKGVGDVLAATLLADMPELGTVSGKQASSLCGLVPFNCDSGTMRGKRKIKGGRFFVRNILYMAIQSTVRFNNDIRIFYERLIKDGKAKKIALVGAMRKLIILINRLIIENRLWEEKIS